MSLFVRTLISPNFCLSEHLCWLHLWSNFKTKHTYRLLITQGTWENNFYSCSATNKNIFSRNFFFHSALFTYSSGGPNLCLSEYLFWLHFWSNVKIKHTYRLLKTQGTWENNFYKCSATNENIFSWNIFFILSTIYLQFW